MKEGKITIRALILGTVFSGLFAFVTVWFENRKDLVVTANQIAVLPYVLLFLCVLLINPVCRLLRFVRRFTVTEILLVFIMCSVSAGISTFGLASQLIPTMGGLYNEHWNNNQTKWNEYVEPSLNESYFLSEPGIREAAREYVAALEKHRETKDIYDRALRFERALAVEAKAEESLEKAKTVPEGAVERAKAIEKAERALDAKHQARKKAERAWRAVQEAEQLGSFREVLVVFKDRLSEYEKDRDGKREDLAKLEARAFEKVKTFRRGLPKSMRAYPGFIMLPNETVEIYLGRWRRLIRGISALGHLRRAEKTLAAVESSGSPPADVLEQIGDSIDSAVARLEPVSGAETLLSRKKELADEWDSANKELLAVRAELKRLRQERRLGEPDQFNRLDSQIDDLSSQADELSGRKKEATRSREQLQVQLDAAKNVAATLAELRKLREAVTGADPPAAAEMTETIRNITRRFPSFDASLRRFIIGEVPWSDWLMPLARWALIIGLTYLVLMTFNVLIFRQWAHNERLIYPLAKLPELLAGADNPGGRPFVPSVFRSGLFWVGLAISGSIMGLNLLHHTNLVPGLPRVDIRISWGNYIQNSALQGLLPGARSSIFFTMIGLAFMIPAKISFSLWFFWVLYMVQLLVLVWVGYGVDERSFPVWWWYTFNFRTAEGAGALMVFAAFILFKCRKYILCFFMPSSVRDLETAERRELRISSFLFLLGSVGLVLLLWRGLGANLFYTILCYFVIIALSIGLARAVTEGGILGFQAWVSPFHLIRTLFGMNKSWTAPPLYAPLMVYYSTMFLDIKTFIVPSMANSIKIRDDMKMGRARFHLSIVLCILVAAAVAVVAHIMMSYGKGADNMQRWFYIHFPKGMFEKIASIAKVQPVDNTACRLWLGFGAMLMVGLLFFRRRFFWLPHPIGLIMLVNPLMYGYWFSLFLGWAAKSLVTKYGSKDAYEKTRNLFVGLIIGELLIVVLGMIVSYSMEIRIPIDLNR